jgi:molybdate transport system substrate-binding protein
MLELTRRHLLRRAGVLVIAAATSWPLTELHAETAKPPIVFAAASLQTALDAIAEDWRKETGKAVTISYGASPALARQVEQGAPADLFISADLDWMDWLQQRNLIKANTRENLLGNTLVLIAPKDAAVSLKIAPGADLATALGDSRLSICEVTAIPAGKYGKAALEKLGMWAGVEHKLAQADTVRVALAFVARGEARLGIVYASDARAEPKVKVVDTFPASTHAPIIYPIALTATSTNADAVAFLAYLKSPSAGRRFVEQGFSTLAP